MKRFPNVPFSYGLSFTLSTVLIDRLDSIPSSRRAVEGMSFERHGLYLLGFL